MKILMANKFNYLRGGADKYFIELADLLSSHGHSVAKFCVDHPENIKDKYPKYYISNIDFNKFSLLKIFKYLSRIFYSFEAAKEFEKAILEFKPDIIHIHNIYHHISPSIFAVAKKYNIPVVMHMHDYKLLCPNYKMYGQNSICEKCKYGKYLNCTTNKCIKNSYLKSFLTTCEMYLHHKIMKIYEKKVDLFIAPSQFVFDKAIEWGIDKNKLTVLPYFINIGPNTMSESENYFLYLGRIEEEKGIYTLLEAMKKLNSDINLKFVGTGSELKNLSEKINNENLADRIKVLGYKSGRDLDELLKKSLALIVPSEWYEVTGIVNLEASLASKPIIASRIGGISEAVLDGQTGYLFEPKDVDDLAEKMQLVLSNKEVSVKLGQKGRQYVESNYSAEKHYENITNIYGSAIK